MQPYYKINEIAMMFDLHPDTLRYYEEQGLITPKRGGNNYRLYSIREICDLNIIQNLRTLDVPLSRIREYMTGRTVSSTIALLHEESAWIDERIAALLALKDGVSYRRQNLERALQLPVGECRLVELGARYIYRLSEGITLEQDVDALFKKLENEHEERLRGIVDKQMGAALHRESVGKGLYNRYAYAFYICSDIDDYDDLLPGGLYASLVYRGAYEHINEALPKLISFIDTQGLHPVAAPMELYHVDIHDSRDVGEFLTELQVRVAR